MVSGDASFRRYFRFEDQGKSVIAVDAPPETEDSQRFIDMARSYKQLGILVPEIYCADETQGFYCQQDFGDQLFSDVVNNNNSQDLYAQALDCLPAIQGCTDIKGESLPQFDSSLIDVEYSLFTNWLVSDYLGLVLNAAQIMTLQGAFEHIKQVFLEQPQVGVHRDFHSRNLMIVNNQQIGIIDFQDAVVGPLTYDAVSLLRDCYKRWPASDVENWLADWHTKHYAQYPWSEFKYWFDMTGLQRHIKASGIFARLCIRDHKPAYLQDIPRTLEYVIEVAHGYPALRDFADLVKEMVLPAVLVSLSQSSNIDGAL